MFDWFKRAVTSRKTDAQTSVGRIQTSLRSGVSWSYDITPERLAMAIEGYAAGRLGDMARIIARFEQRDDTAAICARKNRSAIARCTHNILIAPGSEEDPKAAEHKKILEKFWNSITVTSAFARNERGGMRLLKKQMIDAVSYGYKVHEIVWQPQPDGSLSAVFISLPLWYFENTAGELRYLQQDYSTTGVEMKPSEWLVTCGDAVGIAASIVCLYKRGGIADWASYCERCGQPGIHAATTAADDSPAWARLLNAVGSFGKEWGIVTDKETEINTVNANVGATIPQQPLVERMDRAIAALYRGADLGTLSKDDAVGATLQGDETASLEADACACIEETLRQQVERYVIEWTTGDTVPLAYINVEPVSRPNITQEIQIDTHLVGLGVRLSKSDALARYGRAEAADGVDALVAGPGFGGQPAGLPNEKSAAKNELDKLLAETMKGVGGDPFCSCEKPKIGAEGICEVCGKPIEFTSRETDLKGN